MGYSLCPKKKPTRTADLDYFYGQSSELFSFYRIPKLLFQDSRFQLLSTDAKTLYGILLDRMSLSARNGWLDKAVMKQQLGNPVEGEQLAGLPIEVIKFCGSCRLFFRA